MTAPMSRRRLRNADRCARLRQGLSILAKPEWETANAQGLRDLMRAVENVIVGMMQTLAEEVGLCGECCARPRARGKYLCASCDAGEDT